MNRIRGIAAWTSKHIIVKSEEYQKRRYVDPAGIDRKLFTLPREVSLATGWQKGEVSRGHSSGRKTSRWVKPGVSQNHEGLNVKLSKIRYGGSNLEFASRIPKYDKDIIGEKSYYIMLNEPLYTRTVRTVV